MVLVYECPVLYCGYTVLNYQHPSTGGVEASAWGQCFSLSSDYTLTHVNFRLDRLLNPDAMLCARLYRTVLDGNNRYIPDDNPIDSGILAESDLRPASEVIISGTGTHWFRFDFTGDQRYIMRSGVTYIIQIVAKTVVFIDATNNIRVWGPNTFDTCVCNASGHRSGIWNSWDWAISVQIYGNLYVEPEPEPEPEPEDGEQGFDAPVENIYGGGGEGTLMVEDMEDLHLISPPVDE